MEYGTVRSDADVLQMSLGASGAFRGFIAPVRNARDRNDRRRGRRQRGGEHLLGPRKRVRRALGRRGRREPGGAAFSSGQPINATAAYGTYPDDWPAHYVVPDVTGPGVAVISAEAGTTDGYVRQQGTSMAAPHVSGIAALAVAATDGRVNDSTLQAAIVDTAVHPAGATEPDDRHGHGVVDAPAPSARRSTRRRRSRSRRKRAMTKPRRTTPALMGAHPGSARSPVSSRLACFCRSPAC